MKQTAYICDVCKKGLTTEDCHRAVLYIYDKTQKKERSKTFHFCESCFVKRFGDITDLNEAISEKQMKLIGKIRRITGKKFTGNTKREASAFIKENINEIDEKEV